MRGERVNAGRVRLSQKISALAHVCGLSPSEAINHPGRGCIAGGRRSSTTGRSATPAETQRSLSALARDDPETANS